jgi:succinoglycan biosynthesis transport protein ExoP
VNVRQFLLILLARKKIVLATLLATVLLALGYSLAAPTTYKSTASVLLNYQGAGGGAKVVGSVVMEF